jgi:hypothetical protein
MRKFILASLCSLGFLGSSGVALAEPVEHLNADKLKVCDGDYRTVLHKRLESHVDHVRKLVGSNQFDVDGSGAAFNSRGEIKIIDHRRMAAIGALIGQFASEQTCAMSYEWVRFKVLGLVVEIRINANGEFDQLVAY